MSLGRVASAPGGPTNTEIYGHTPSASSSGSASHTSHGHGHSRSASAGASLGFGLGHGMGGHAEQGRGGGGGNGLSIVEGGVVDETTPLLSPCVDEVFHVDVYPLVHEIRVDIVAHIDTPLTYDQLIAPDSTYTIIRPLVAKYLGQRNPSVVFCLLLNKVQFISDSHKLSIATLSESRAVLCEILALRVLRGWSERSLPLATVLLTSFRMFQGAPKEVIEAVKEEGEDEVLDNSGTALEMAIISSSKRFIRSPSCQKVIEGIWSGKIIYSSHSSHALIQDNYKKRPLQIYNPHTAPLLDHYRLKVPKIRALLEYINFVILFILYIVAVQGIEEHHITGWEAIFMIYAIAFSVDKLAATREHGMRVFTSSLVNGFDLIFVIIFLVSFFLRIYGTVFHNSDVMGYGADLLALGSVLMFPRLVFMTLANNLMILSIRSMLMEFACELEFLMIVGIICFLGFLYALFTLGEGKYKVSEITWWLLEIYFGLDATGFLTSSQIHPYIGPVLMVIYAFLSNTLLLTVAVAILGNTFAVINADAAAESMFRKAVATIEGVKADSVFSYQLPFNLIALVFLWPLSYVLNPRWFHKVNVTMIRVTNLPVLLIIALYERHKYGSMSVWEQVCDYTDYYATKLRAAAGFEGFAGTRMDVSAVFEVEREFGTYYEGWDDAGPDDDEDHDTCAVDDEEEGTESSESAFVHDSHHHITTSPVEETNMSFPPPGSVTSPGHASNSGANSLNTSPVQPRKRRNSLSALLSPQTTAGGLPVPPTGPLPNPNPRLRRASNMHVYGPSPLAQLFVRSPEQEMGGVNGPLRRSTVAVGSLPAPSSMPLSGSPRRSRVSFGTSGPAGLSSSLSTSSIASIEARGGPRVVKAPSVTPIQEDAVASQAGSATDLPAEADKESSKAPDSPSSPVSPKKPIIQFPTDAEVRQPSRVHVSFGSAPNTSPTTPTARLPPTILEPETSPERSEKSERSERSDRPEKPEREKPEKPEKEKRDKSKSGKAAPSPRLKPSTTGAVPGLKAGQGSKAPMTASELLEALEAQGAGDDPLAQLAAIAKIEQRQKRIETLLEQLLAAQTKADTSGVTVQGALRCAPRREDPHDTFDDMVE